MPDVFTLFLNKDDDDDDDDASSLSKGLDDPLPPPPPPPRSQGLDPALFSICLQHDLTKSGIIWVDFRLVSNVSTRP